MSLPLKQAVSPSNCDRLLTVDRVLLLDPLDAELD